MNAACHHFCFPLLWKLFYIASFCRPSNPTVSEAARIDHYPKNCYKINILNSLFSFEGCLHVRQGELRVLGPQEALAGEASCRQGRRERHEPQQVPNAHASTIKHKHFSAVLGIRIRIQMFLGLQDPDPDPLVRGMDPDQAPDPFLLWNNVCKIGF